MCECECVHARCVSVRVYMCGVCMVCTCAVCACHVCVWVGGGYPFTLVVFHRRKVDVCVGVCHDVPRAVERDPDHGLVRPFGLHNGLLRRFVRVLSSRLRSNSQFKRVVGGKGVHVRVNDVQTCFVLAETADTSVPRTRSSSQWGSCKHRKQASTCPYDRVFGSA